MLLPKKKRYELKERSRYISINPDSKDELDKKGRQERARRKSIDEKMYNATSSPNYTDGFFTSETEEIELSDHSQKPPS